MAASSSLASSFFSIKNSMILFLLLRECSPLDSSEPESFGSKLLNSEHRQVLHFGSLSLDTNTFVDVKDSEFQLISKLKITYMYINECVFLMFVFQNFDCMVMIAVEGTYSKIEALLNLNIHPLDILLMLAATEGDRPETEELLRAGVDSSVKDADGRTAIDRASNEEIRKLILGYSTQKADSTTSF